MKDASLAEELPYWDFFDSPRPHAVLTDGSLVGGLRASLVDIECLSDEQVNQFTVGLRSALNAVAECVSLQFVLSVRSDFSGMLDAHENGKSATIPPSRKEHRGSSRARASRCRGEV